jgi:SAM-dependent methyltransferase
MNAETKPLLQQVPANRSYESVLNHYEVERAIANRLKKSDRKTRKAIYGSMYDELFARVLDHPRLTRRADEAMTLRNIATKTSLLRPFIREDATFLEFGSGDCRFVFAMAGQFREVYAVDIADQIGPEVDRPGNFHLTVYDGYDLDLPANSIDVAFSDQLIEHLHPEDTAAHFKLVQRLLKPGGVYLFRTPHRLTGPHDVSRYFCEEAECFHLKEWTYGELADLLADLGFRSVRAYWFGKGLRLRLPLALFRTIEAAIRGAPHGLRQNWLPLLLPSVSIAAFK